MATSILEGLKLLASLICFQHASILLLVALVVELFVSSNYISSLFVKILGDAGPSVVNGFETFFFDGNQTHSKVVSELKDNFLKFARGPYVPPWYCQANSACRRDKIRAYV